jgi:hypothetical protein
MDFTSASSLKQQSADRHVAPLGPWDNRISRVVVSALASSVVDPVCSSPDRVKPKTIKLVCVASELRTQHLGERVYVTIKFTKGGNEKSQFEEGKIMQRPK